MKPTATATSIARIAGMLRGSAALIGCPSPDARARFLREIRCVERDVLQPHRPPFWPEDGSQPAL